MEKLDIKDISQRINDIENLMKQKIVQEKKDMENMIDQEKKICKIKLVKLKK